MASGFKFEKKRLRMYNSIQVAWTTETGLKTVKASRKMDAVGGGQ